MAAPDTAHVTLIWVRGGEHPALNRQALYNAKRLVNPRSGSPSTSPTSIPAEISRAVTFSSHASSLSSSAAARPSHSPPRRGRRPGRCADPGRPARHRTIAGAQPRNSPAARQTGMNPEGWAWSQGPARPSTPRRQRCLPVLRHSLSLPLRGRQFDQHCNTGDLRPALFHEFAAGRQRPRRSRQIVHHEHCFPAVIASESRPVGPSRRVIRIHARCRGASRACRIGTNPQRVTASPSRR